jgi:drug/metabolite transporter (DMT)-like permease
LVAAEPLPNTTSPPHPEAIAHQVEMHPKERDVIHAWFAANTPATRVVVVSWQNARGDTQHQMGYMPTEANHYHQAQPMTSNEAKAPISPFLGLIIGVLASSSASIMIRFAQGEAPSLVIAAYRLALASLILLPISLFRRGNDYRALRPRHLLLIIIAGISLAAHFATWISSLEYTSVASSAILVSTSPIFVSLLAPFFLKEAVTSKHRIGIMIAFAGSILIGLSDVCRNHGRFECPPLSSFFRGTAIQGDLLALAGALSIVAYLLIGRYLRAKIPLLPYIFLTYSVAATSLIITVFLMDLEPFHYTPRTYLWFLLLALIPQLVGHNSVNWALRYLPASIVSVTLLLEPVASTTWAYLLLNEQPLSSVLIGGVLVLTGIGLASMHKAKPPRDIGVETI